MATLSDQRAQRMVGEVPGAVMLDDPGRYQPLDDAGIDGVLDANDENGEDSGEPHGRPRVDHQEDADRQHDGEQAGQGRDRPTYHEAHSDPTAYLRACQRMAGGVYELELYRQPAHRRLVAFYVHRDPAACQRDAVDPQPADLFW